MSSEEIRSETTRMSTESSASATTMTPKVLATLDATLREVQKRFMQRKEVQTTITQPRALSTFGIKDDVYVADATHFLKEFRQPKLPADLNEGYDTWKRKDEEKDGDIYPLLHHILHDKKYDTSNIDIISYRNNFNKIMCTPYSKNSWEIDIMRVGPTLVFNIRHTKSTDPQLDKFTYYGYKFEEICTREDPDKSRVVDNTEQFCVTYQLKIGKYRMMLGAETDCYENITLPVKDGESNKRWLVQSYAELKTTKVISTEKDSFSFKRYKMLNYWIQSFLVGVPHVIVGFRDEEGVVQSIKRYKTTDFTKLNDKLWDGRLCLFFTEEILDLVALHCKEEDSLYNLRFEWPLVTLTKLPLDAIPAQRSTFIEPLRSTRQSTNSNTGLK